jgi:hypothetical protein
MGVSVSSHPGRPGRKSWFRARGRRGVRRPWSPTRRRRGATPGSRARIVGLWGGEGGEGVARRAPALPRAFGVRRVVLGLAGREGVPVPREGEGDDGPADEAGLRAQRGDEGARGALATEGQGWPLEPRAPGAHPRIEGVGLVVGDAERMCLGASGLHAALVCGLRPVEADEGRQRRRRETRQGSPPGRGVRRWSRARRACVLRRPERAPGARQTRRRRGRTPAHLRMRGSGSKPPVLGQGDSSAAGADSCVHWERPPSCVAYHGTQDCLPITGRELTR